MNIITILEETLKCRVPWGKIVILYAFKLGEYFKEDLEIKDSYFKKEIIQQIINITENKEAIFQDAVLYNLLVKYSKKERLQLAISHDNFNLTKYFVYNTDDIDEIWSAYRKAREMNNGTNEGSIAAFLLNFLGGYQRIEYFVKYYREFPGSWWTILTDTIEEIIKLYPFIFLHKILKCENEQVRITLLKSLINECKIDYNKEPIHSMIINYIDIIEEK